MPRQFFPDLAFGWTFYAVLVLLLAISSVIDFRTRRIPKTLTLTCLLLGLSFNLGRGLWLGLQEKSVWWLPAGPVSGAIDGLLFSVFGFAAAFGVFFALWFLKAAGGGDVKMFAAVGAWVGPWYMVLVMVAAVLAVVMISIGMMLASLLTSGFAKTRKNFSHKQNQQNQTGKVRKGPQPTFSFPLALATAMVMLAVLAKDLGLTAVPQPADPTPVSQAK